MSLAPYPLALLRLMKEDEGSVTNPPLGIAKRAGVENSVYNVPTHHFLHALIDHAISPDTMAKEFLVELGKCGTPAVELLVQAVHSGTWTKAPGDWAAIVYQHLKEPVGDLTPLTQLGSHYFSHLVIAFRNPGGKKTPQDSIHPTPNLRPIAEIDELLHKAVSQRSQSALRELVILRDGVNCLVTGYSFTPPRAVIPRCAHIIPFSIHSKTQTHAAIEMFTGHVLNTEFIQHHINHPKNALNLQNDAHDSMDKNLAWGIEAKFSDNQWRYYYRIVRPDGVSPITRLTDGEEIMFGNGPGGREVALPDPMLCNLFLAISRVSYASGASEIFDQFLDDEDEDGWQVPIYFGGPFVSDDVLMRKLEALAG